MNQDVTIVDSQTAKDGKLLALLSHFWVIGTIAAWVLNLSKKNEFSAFYIRQMIGFQLLTFIVEGIVVSILGSFIAKVIGLFLFIFWVMSLFGSLSDKLKLMPVVGSYFQKIFRSL